MSPPQALLGRILADLGSTLVEVVAGRADPARPVTGVLIHDPGDESARMPGAIVLGVGVYGAGNIAALTDQAKASGAAAVLVRSPVPADGLIAEAVIRNDLPVLGLTPGASWAQVAALLRSLVAAPDELGGDEPLPGDLFALANATAALLDGPVTVEDRNGRVLAFSSRQEEGDEERIATILGRQVPAEKLRALEQRGDFSNLYRANGPIYIEGAAGKPRTAIAVRAGGEILGSIWVVVAGPMSEVQDRALRESAKVAALHLLRQRSSEDAERRLRADLLAAVLEGGPLASQAAVQLGLMAQPACVLAVMATDVVSPAPSSLADHVAAGDRLAGALTLHLSAIHPGAAVASLGGVIYAVLPTTSAERAIQVAEEFLSRIHSRMPALIGIGRVASRPTDLRQSRAEADRVLRVLAGGRSRLKVARLSDVYAASLLDELSDRIVADDDIPDGPVIRLRAHDAKHHTAFTETLSAWLDSFGDVIAAAASIHVHPNTFRYRLKRLAEVAELDLSNPDARFEAMLQLRLVPRNIPQDTP